MEINVISIFPEMFDAITEYGITRNAVDKKALTLRRFDPRDFTEDRYRSVDDRPYGGGPGMLMKPEPLARCIDASLESNPGPVVYLSPQGERLTQSLVEELSVLQGINLLCGRYEGIDERVIESRVDREISIGDYVLAGGELAAMVVIDAVTRLLPGVLGNDLSVAQDSFNNGLLDCPHYTRPESFENVRVPEILLSGDHEKIRQWRLNQSIARTRERRPELLKEFDSGDNE